LSNWKALTRYCEDGDLEIDNNGAERSLRGIAVGRRNWTFYGSDNGGRTAAVLTSLIATCKRLGHRSLRLPARHLRTHQRHPQKPAGRTAPDD
jgi:transposase